MPCLPPERNPFRGAMKAAAAAVATVAVAAAAL